MLSQINRLNVTLSILCIFAIFVLVLMQVILRVFNLYIPSLNEISGYLLICSFFLALGYSFEQAKHIRVSLIFELHNPKLSHMAELFSYVLASLISVFISYALLQLTLDSYQFKEVSSGEIAILEWPIQAILVYASVIMTLTIGYKGWEILRGHR